MLHAQTSLCVTLISVLITINCKLIEDATIVQLPKGKIRGHILKSANNKDFYAFQEIPYAAPPVGQNRFKLPKEPEAWNDVLDTTKNTKICYQYETRYHNLEITEDCLYLNVYTPRIPGSDDLLPVLFYIHGGSLVNDSGTIEYYGPKYLIDHEVVIVTINYRMGPFGFVGTNDGVIPLNLGFKDQVLAIEWVNQNIHLFGGDPDSVTLVGQSAGSLSVGYHLIGPWNNGKQLFHGVIMQSGTPVSGLLEQQPGTETETAFQLGRAIDPSFTSNNTKDLLKLLIDADAHDLMWTHIVGGAALERDGPFSYLPLQSFIDGNYKKVPVLLGFNSEEWLFAYFDLSNEFLETVDQNPDLLIRSLLNMSTENRRIAGKLLQQLYTKNKTFVQDWGAYVRYITDEYFTTGIFKQVELASSHVPYYLYKFSYKGYLGEQMDMLPYLPADVETVAHAEEVTYMWDNGSNSDLSQFPKEDVLMSQRFLKLWTNFVKYHNPTPEVDTLFDNVIWEKSNASIKYLNINKTFAMQEYPRQFEAVKRIKETYMERPYNCI
ncbi:juvenile hormone esterase-like [Diorhabda carinulata]|uniref:juvenile hormone esterase-like n=1 Tax=Diorhabda carinulata TaxID=1163345 RepID=UPI0025A2756E|nr:juvenile hormone esterase-like [Diorhabda carinulata]